MEQEALQKKSSSGITLEPLDHGGQTLHWDAIERCVTKSLDDPCETAVANALGAVRKREMLAWAVWRDGQVGAIMITRPMEDGYSGGRAMLIYGMEGDGLSLPQWIEAGGIFEKMLTAAGFDKLIAYAKDPLIVQLCVALGWKTQTLCYKELSNG